MAAIPGRILVPVDGSPASLRAVRHAAVLLRAGLAQSAVLLNVQPPVMSGEVSPLVELEEVQRMRQTAGEHTLAAARQVFADADTPCELRIACGDAGDTIAATVVESACTQVVMGTRGLGKIANLVVGSVANRVLHLVNVPLTLIK
jgi:nucleotide-binding universal stress UspA family protein